MKPKWKFKLDEAIAVYFLVQMTIVALLQICFRFANKPLDWSEELIRYSLVALIYISTVIVIKEDKMIRVEIVDLLVKGKVKQVLDLLIRFISGGFTFYIAYLATFLVKNAERVNQVTPSLQIPFTMLYGMESLAFFLMGFMFLMNTITRGIAIFRTPSLKKTEETPKEKESDDPC